MGYFPVNFSDTSGNPVASKLYQMDQILLSQPLFRAICLSSAFPRARENDLIIHGVIKAVREIFRETAGTRTQYPHALCHSWAPFAQAALAEADLYGLSKHKW
jgi:succinyl-CoA synthetase beta subunit